MIKDLIIREVDRDLQGLGYLIEATENTQGTRLPVHCYISTRKENKVKHGVFYASMFATAVAGATTDFKTIDFSNKSNGSAIETYKKYVETPFNLYLSEYKQLYEHTSALENFLNEVLSFKSLKNNWDGYGAIPTEVKSATQTISIAHKLPERLLSKLSEVFPNPNGTVTLEWENYSGERLVAEVGNFSFSYYVKLNALTPKFYNDVQISDETIQELSTNIRKLFI